MNLTRHATTRTQQRGIPPLVVEWLLSYGSRRPSGGAVHVSFDKRARRALASDVGYLLVKQVGRFLQTSLVVDPETDQVITVMWNS